MITIKDLGITVVKDKARLSADVDVDGVSNSLWFEVDARYAKFLCEERCDAFVLGLLHWAMRHGHDIVSEIPMTDRLYEQITTQFLPAFYCANGFTRAVKRPWGVGYRVEIRVPLASEVVHPAGGDAVGAGCSCGVDSMHVYARHPELTHACVWNVHGVTNDETADVRAQGWKNLIAQAKRFADAAHCELIVCDTNYDRGCISDLMFDGSTGYANLFCIFCLQKLWKAYHIASAYEAGNYRLNVSVNTSPVYYEYYLFACCSTSYVSVRLDGVDCSRLQKVRDIVDYPLSRQFLNVCWTIREDGRNCTCHCAKCMRTLIELDACNAVERYGAVFDVKHYIGNREEYLAEYWRGLLQKNQYALEVRETFGRKVFTLREYALACLIVMRKVTKKFLRCGVTRQGEFLPRG